MTSCDREIGWYRKLAKSYEFLRRKFQLEKNRCNENRLLSLARFDVGWLANRVDEDFTLRISFNFTDILPSKGIENLAALGGVFELLQRQSVCRDV